MTPTLTDDLANVLVLVQRVFVGPCAIRDEIARVLDRYAEAEHIRMEQLNADRAVIVVREIITHDQWGIPLSLRADILEDSRSRIAIDGELIPF